MAGRHVLWVVEILAAALIARTAVVGAGAATPATNEVDLHKVVPIVNACTGELLVFDVTFHALEPVTTDPNGGTHIKLHIQGMQVTGVGTETKTEHFGKNMYGETDFIAVDGTEVVTFVRPLHRVSQGPGDNRLRNVTTHVTVNAQCEATVDLFGDRPACDG